MLERYSTLMKHLKLSNQRYRQLWYAPILGLAMAIMMTRLVWLAGQLPVEAFASLAFGLLISSAFGIIGAIGLQPLLQRDMPGLLILGKENSARRLLIQAITLSLVCFLAASPLIYFGPELSAYPQAIWAAGLLHGLAQQMFLLATTDSRSRGDPLTFAFDNLYRALLVAIVSWLVAASTGSASAVLLAESFASILLSIRALKIIFLRDDSPAHLQIRQAINGISRLPWGNALFLLSASLLAYGILNLDRWVASFWLTTPDFAQYAFAAIGLMIAQSTQSLLNAAVFPMVARRHASQGNESSYKLARNLSWACLALGATAGPIFAVATEHLVEAWFPQYVGAIPLMWPILIIAVLRLSDFHSTYILVSGHERALTCVNLLILLCAGGALILLSAQPYSAILTPLQAVMKLAVCVGVGHYIAILITANWLYRTQNIKPR